MEIPVVDVFNVSNVASEHPNRFNRPVQDCLHVCQDGNMLTEWNALLLDELKHRTS